MYDKIKLSYSQKSVETFTTADLKPPVNTPPEVNPFKVELGADEINNDESKLP